MGWAGLSGGKNGYHKWGRIRNPPRPWQPSPNSQNTKKTLGKQGVLGNVEILVATKNTETLKTLGKTRILVKSESHLEAKIAKNLT